jgi:hypothetical protein
VFHSSTTNTQVRGAQEERLLPEPLGVEAGVESQRALETQEAHHPRLHQAAQLRGLDIYAEISRRDRLAPRSPTQEELQAAACGVKSFWGSRFGNT